MRGPTEKLTVSRRGKCREEFKAGRSSIFKGQGVLAFFVLQDQRQMEQDSLTSKCV
jgi:hypothetical protein